MTDIITLRGSKLDPQPIPKFVKTGIRTSANTDLTDLINKGLTIRKTQDQGGNLWCGSAANCSRKGAIHATLVQTVFENAANFAYYKLGDCIEEIVLTGLHEVGSLLFKSYIMPDVGLRLRGKADGIIFHDGKIRVLEVKSCGELPSNPKPEHQAQALLYAALTGFKAILYYFSRTSVATYEEELVTREFDLSVDGTDNLPRLYLHQAIYARLALNMGVLPAKPYHLEFKANCGRCDHIDFCWKNGENPTNLPIVNADQHIELLTHTNELVDRLMAPEAVQSRRNGVLRFISLNGNDHAKKLLNDRSIPWSSLV